MSYFVFAISRHSLVTSHLAAIVVLQLIHFAAVT